MRKKNCLCLLVCVAMLVTITTTRAVAQDAAAPRKKWYQKIFKPIRNPFKRKSRAKQAEMADRDSSNPFFRNRASRDNGPIPSDDPFAGRQMNGFDRGGEFDRTENTRSMTASRTEPHGNSVIRAGYRQRDTESFDRERGFTGPDGRNMVRNYSDDGYSSIDNAVRPNQDRLARTETPDRGDYNRERSLTARDSHGFVPNAIGNGRSRILNTDPGTRERIGQTDYTRRELELLAGEQTARRADPRFTRERTEDGRYRTSTTTLPNGNEITRTNSFERDGNSFTRERSLTGPNGQTFTQSSTREFGDGTRSFERTTTLPNGNEITRTGFSERDDNTFAREQSITDPNGQTLTRTGTREFGDGGRSFDRTTTLPNGNQITRTGSIERDGNAFTREQSFFGSDGQARTRTSTGEQTSPPASPDRNFSRRTADFPSRTPERARGLSSMPRGITPSATRTATRSLTHRRSSLQGVRESTVQRRQVPPASSLRGNAGSLRRPNVPDTVSNRANNGTTQLQRARRAFRRAKR